MGKPAFQLSKVPQAKELLLLSESRGVPLAADLSRRDMAYERFSFYKKIGSVERKSGEPISKDTILAR